MFKIERQLANALTITVADLIGIVGVVASSLAKDATIQVGFQSILFMSAAHCSSQSQGVSG